MSAAELQSALWRWFWQDPSSFKTPRSVDNSCAGLFQCFHPEKEKRYARYELLYPLIRHGTIEFYGRQGFGLAPTSALLANGKVLFTNLPDTLRERLPGHDSLESPGQQVIPYDLEIRQFIQNAGIPAARFELSDFLKELPTLGSMIASWETAKIIDASGFLYYQDQWRPYPGDDHPGVFKRSDLPYAQRLCRLPSGEFKAIPGTDQQIDAFSLAVYWGRVARGEKPGVEYDTGTQQLKINSTLFPLVLERLLWINGLLKGNYPTANDHRVYHLAPGDFKVLNRFFHNSIKLDYE